MTPVDIPAGLRLCRACGWNQIEDDWRAFLELPGGACRLGMNDDGVAVGTVGSLRYGPHFTWLAMMLVDPQHRRSGVGSMLLEAELDFLATETCIRLDATPAGEPLYRRHEFVAEYELFRLKTVHAGETACATTRNQAYANLGGAGFQPAEAVRPIAAADLPAIFAMDREVFGDDRSGLLRTFYQRAPQLAFITQDLAGYCFGRPGYLYTQLGPVVAQDRATAGQLVAHSLGQHPGAIFNLDASAADHPWIEWLQSAGFVIERPFLRMRRGPLAYTEKRDLQFGIAGPEFG